MANDPLWINESGGSPAYAANELRQAMGLAMMWGGRQMGSRPGIRPGGTQLQVSLAGSTITVQPGVACVDPGLSTPQAAYWVAHSPASTHTLAAADLTNPRRDRVILRVYDDDEDSSGMRTAVTEYMVGTPAPVPVGPAIPSGSIHLAFIDSPVSGGGSPTVIQGNVFTVASGGLLPVASQTERDSVVSPYDGQATWRRDTDTIDVFNGSSFVQFLDSTKLPEVLDAVDISAAGSLYTTSGTIELDIARLVHPNIVLSTSQLYLVEVRMITTRTASTDEFELRVRQGTAISGSLRASRPIYAAPSSAGHIASASVPFVPASSTTAAINVSIVRATGSGTMSIFGSTPIGRTQSILWRLGPATRYRTIAV